MNHERRRVAPAPATDDESQHDNTDHRQRTAKPVRFRKAPGTRIAEPAAGPNTPAQAHDFGAAVSAEVGTIIREKRQVYEDLSPGL